VLHAHLLERGIDGQRSGPDLMLRSVDGQRQRPATCQHNAAAVLDGTIRGWSQGVLIPSLQSRRFQGSGNGGGERMDGSLLAVHRDGDGFVHGKRCSSAGWQAQAKSNQGAPDDCASGHLGPVVAGPGRGSTRTNAPTSRAGSLPHPGC
jgi:hypothetical protein